MPEGHRAPWRFFPRPGASLSVTFGAPLPEASARATLGTGMGSGVGEEGEGKHQEGYVKREAGAEVETRIAVLDLGRGPDHQRLGFRVRFVFRIGSLVNGSDSDT